MPDIATGDRVLLRKKHPCGSVEWRVIQVGMDVVLRCLGCDRQIRLTRRECGKRIRKVIPANGDLTTND